MPRQNNRTPALGFDHDGAAARSPRSAHPPQLSPTAPAARLGSDDALLCAASDTAARRPLLAALRDAHAETCVRIVSLRRCDAVLAGQDLPVRGILARLLGEAEEQLWRLETVFVGLRERLGAGMVRSAGMDLPEMLARTGPATDLALLLALAAMERSGAEEARHLRQLAFTTEHNLAARLLDMTSAEREGSACGLEMLVQLRGLEVDQH